MRTSLLFGFGVLALLIVSVVIVVLSVQDKNDRLLNSSNSDTPEIKLPDNQRETVVVNVANESGIGKLPMPVFREDVIVYFKDMPLSLEEFVSKYGGKPIFIKQDINMAAFETNPRGKTGEVSQRTLDFINDVSKDSLVEKAYHDEFMFIKPGKVLSPEPQITYPKDFDIKGFEYAPKEAKVGFWRLPSSLEKFASKYGAKLVYVDDVLFFAVFETDNTTEFFKNISTDPYVRHAEPNGIFHVGLYTK